jgi:ribosome-associated translation inhibitor RaiA
MQIQVNTDKTIQGVESLIDYVERELRSTLQRHQDQITRLEVHLSDVNGAKRGVNDKRCMIEARLAGRQPEVVTELAGDLRTAISGASRKLLRLLASSLGKLDQAKGGASIRKDGA